MEFGFRRQGVLLTCLVDYFGGGVGPGRMQKACGLSCSDLKWIEICHLQSTQGLHRCSYTVFWETGKGGLI